MKELFRQLIVDFHKRELPELTARNLSIPLFPSGVRKAIVFIGMRRSGKTWSMYQMMKELVQKGTPISKMLYLNFEDDRLGEVTSKDLGKILEAYFSLYPEYIDSKDLHFFFDEIHEVAGWEKFVRRLLDSETMQITITGSSAKMLSKEIATSLRGRTFTREIFPYNFKEYLEQRTIIFHTPLASKERYAIFAYAEEFIRMGGFPETVGLDGTLHREILQGYIESVIYRDIIDRYKVTNSAVLKRLLTHCLQNAAAPCSINKIYKNMKSMGYAVSKNSLYEYMLYFEDAYCLFSLPVYNPSARKSSQQPKKVYPVDQGLITAYGWNEQFRHGARLETAVFSSLRRVYSDCFYYTTRDGYEVDFLVASSDGGVNIYQVSLSLSDKNTREREVRALSAAMEELSLSHSTIITLEERETIALEQGVIESIPVADWLYFFPSNLGEAT